MSKFKVNVLATSIFLAISSYASAASLGNVGDTLGPSGNTIGNAGSASVAIGQHSSATGAGGVAIGKGTEANNAETTAIGFQAVVSANTGVALGSRAQTTATSGVALGTGSIATVTSGVALGANSKADRAGGSFGASSDGTALTEAVSFGNVGDKTTREWTSNAGVVSIGSSAMSRQLTGLAAGSQDNDAVNVAQLKSLQQSSVFGSGASIQIPEDATDPNNVVPARDALNATVLGDNAKVQADGAVAIGANSIAQSRIIETTDETGATIRTAPTGYLMPTSGVTDTSVWQGDANHGVVSFGGSYTNDAGETVNFNRQITGVAAGSEDNDAVNVAQLREVNNQVQGLVTGDTKVSTIQLTSDPEDENAPTIGLRYQAAEAAPAAQADGDSVTPTVSQGRLVYSNVDANGNNLGTVETIATLSDGIKLSGGTTTGADGTTVDSVNVNLNQGISFLGDEYLQTTVTAGENGGAVVTVGASQALKDFLANSGVQPSDPSNPSNPGGGSTGGTWTPNAAQQAALNGNFANGITVAAGEGNQAIQIKQGNVDMGGNRIQNVGNPINDGDAANKAYVDSTSRSLRNKINDVDKDLRAGVAMAMAVGNLPQAYMPGKSILAVSAGTYHGQGGFALGLSHATDNRQWVFKGAASVDTRGNFGGTLSAGYQF